MENKIFLVPDIGCDGCVRTVEKEIRDLTGIQIVETELDSHLVTVEWDTPASWNTINAKLVEIDYPPAKRGE